ncbi:hypothetical protein BCR35DRAFT_311377 [Leucosporidium creatinivorum]|uniref:Thioredoxin domain-containing protein n=1 Tax=Leucosporidium creatinivorum TaxID=106004 RepID=A0A1Y2C249_9BASI|nr:hypothetical protein BCR35DRAFT_311377 [Leucosporidium creatinivorum]
MADKGTDDRYLIARLAHPHYILNSLLCLPVPILVAQIASLDRKTILLLALAPFLLIGQLHGFKGFGDLESVVEAATWQLRLFNLVALVFLRGDLSGFNLNGWHAAAYLGIWLVISFVYPQPPYLGPSKLTELTSEDFDEQISIVPPATTFSSSTTSAEATSAPKIVELPSEAELAAAYNVRRRESTKYSVVLFHADWSKRSRELEITLSRLSWIYDSPTLSFHLITPDNAPSTFYDLNLSIHPTSLDLPVLRLYRGGKVLAQLPKAAEEVRAERRTKKLERRKEREAEKRRKRKGKSSAEQDESESGSETDESDEEREAEQEVALARYKWDRSAKSIEVAFRLAERSGRPPPTTSQ